MTNKTHLANGRLILGDEIITGGIVFDDTGILDIHSGANVSSGAIDCGGDFVGPGLVELHTDNLERHLEPRPGVSWPHGPAVLAHDRELGACGITTVFDAIRIGSFRTKNKNTREGREYAREMADDILAMRQAGQLRISHHLHLRAEICSESLLDEFAKFGPHDRVGIVSLMDHTPGQRQFRDVSKLRVYHQGKNGLSDAEFVDYVHELQELSARVGELHEAQTVRHAKRLGATLASHDDTTPDQVAVSLGHGVRIAEFPTTYESAKACRENDIAIMMGAPNLVRGGSHSGNVAAGDLAKFDLIDILSSDYVPAALLMGAVILGAQWGNYARSHAAVSQNPARAVALHDRGVLEIGKRADLIRYALVERPGKEPIPAIRSVYANGAVIG